MNGPTRKGKVYFMGVFPGDADLLTAEGVRILRAAEVVLHDAEVAQAVLDLIPAWTQVRNGGNGTGGAGLSQDKIHALLIAAAREGHQVVRLKAGDVPVAESAGEEMEALEQAGVEFEVIRGTASAVGASAGASSR
jgi:uroporphyrin-III C-methyltransferase